MKNIKLNEEYSLKISGKNTGVITAGVYTNRYKFPLCSKNFLDYTTTKEIIYWGNTIINNY